MTSTSPDADPAAPERRGRPRRWLRRAGVGLPEDELDIEAAEAFVHRSAEADRHPEVAAPVETEPTDEDRDNVVELRSEPTAEPPAVPIAEPTAVPPAVPTAEELEAQAARRAASDAASSAATQRVIAATLASGFSDPDEEPTVRKGLFRRKKSYAYVGPARSDRRRTDAAGGAGATAEVAERARAEADRAVAFHAAQARRAEAAAEEAAQAREVAEAAAREHSTVARTESMRRETAEQLASEQTALAERAYADRMKIEAEARAVAEQAQQYAAARAEAEQAAREHAENARLQAERAAAAAAAREQAEATARELTERLAVIEAVAAQHASSRLDADQVAQRQAAAAEAAHAARVEAETAARTQAEAAARAQTERAAAEARAQELAASLEEARAALLAKEQAELARLAAPPAPATPAPAVGKPSTPAPVAAEHAPAKAHEGPVIATPPRGEDVVHFAPRGSSALLTVVLALGALAGAAATVYEAYRDQLTATPGIVASVVTLALVLAVSRTRAGGTAVSIERGVVQVETDEGRRRFDLTSPSTLVEMVGEPGERGWKVLFLFRTKSPFTIDDSMVDPEEFTDALRRWRPTL